MTIKEALFARLIADAGVSPLIGKRLYPEFVFKIDQVYPLAVYIWDEDISDRSMDGSKAGPTRVSLAIQAISPSYTQTQALATAIVSALDCTNIAWSGIQIQACMHEGTEETKGVIAESEETILHCHNVKFFLAFAPA